MLLDDTGRAERLHDVRIDLRLPETPSSLYRLRHSEGDDQQYGGQDKENVAQDRDEDQQ